MAEKNPERDSGYFLQVKRMRSHPQRKNDEPTIFRRLFEKVIRLERKFKDFLWRSV